MHPHAIEICLFNPQLQARAAERRFEEQRQENSQLRTRLTVIQKERDETHIHSSISKPAPKRVYFLN